MSRSWTEGRTDTTRVSPIDEILARNTTTVTDPAATRYGEGEGRRRQQEREDVAETYPGMDIRLPSGEHRGVFYYDLSGGPLMDAHHTTITVPCRRETLVIRGYRLEPVFRAIMHHSLDILQVTHRAEFDAEHGEEPVISSVEIVTREAMN